MNVKSVPPSEIEGLSVSVVVYRPDLARLVSTLDSFRVACDKLRDARPAFPIELYLIDNGGLPDLHAVRQELHAHAIACRVVTGHGNVGYGRGHNLAIEQTERQYHLVLNPDIDLESDALVRALDFFDLNPDLGLLSPRIGDEKGQLQYLCRRYPALLDLGVRGFLPASARRMFACRLARYEMRDSINDNDTVWDPPIVSGCFMFFRTSVLKRLRGFDERYFLYFEDYDLSLRTHDASRIVYAPIVRVRHHGGDAAKKGSAHIRMFAASAYKFFNRFGWKWL